MAGTITFLDLETGTNDRKIHDIGAIRTDRATFHGASVSEFEQFLRGSEFLCGHNIVHHDMTFLLPRLKETLSAKYIDTLYLSPLLFPKRPYHALVKDDKLQTDELNNPLNDAKKAEKLFYDEVSAFQNLTPGMAEIYCGLLYPYPEFQGFFDYMGCSPDCSDAAGVILRELEGKICANTDLPDLIRRFPVELAYALALISCEDHYSVTPPWLLKNYPNIEHVIRVLCSTPCSQGCPYCSSALNIHRGLKEIFGYSEFRTYDGAPLQERAAQAAMDGKSLLAVFPTGGGKSITFQLPALMAGTAMHALTVVISPLQSLMKDQVDNLSEVGIVDAVTVNGLLSPVERAEAYERVESGMATLLYISPEQLRSRTIERLLMARNIVRFVIDEAHCFSAWGQDFRVDYLYIGEFIQRLSLAKGMEHAIPVSCFTATAKPKVISDICDYFKRCLDIDLDLYTSDSMRQNLHYTVLFRETEAEKYMTLRSLIETRDCPTIVYVSRTKRTRELAEKLTRDGFPALAFHGKMSPTEKVESQEAFIQNQVKVIVATSAFGMGVDKKDVRLVVHYDISDSLENYLQEAGRAGRDPSLQADCYVLYNDNDLDKHFILLNQSKLSISEIQQIWKAIKDLTHYRHDVSCSPLEIARQAGWDDSVLDLETRVKTAVAALENAGYVKRGRNVPHIYATSILAKDMEEASQTIEQSKLFDEQQKLDSKRIIKSLITKRSIAQASNDDAESRVDYLADRLGIRKSDVITDINLMRQEKLLADAQDMSAYILKSDTENKSLQILDRFARLEQFLLENLPEQECTFDYKQWNEAALGAGLSACNVKSLKTLLYFLTIKHDITKQDDNYHHTASVTLALPQKKLLDKFHRRIDVCRFIVNELFGCADQIEKKDREETPVQFSLVGLFQTYRETRQLDFDYAAVTLDDISDALLYLSKIGAMKLEGGFLVSYNAMEIHRLAIDNRIKYKAKDYRLLNEFYQQKIQQIHIVGEFANLMVRDYDAALAYVQDYFQMDCRDFIDKYFKGSRKKQINQTITSGKYRQLFGELSETQSQIIQDQSSQYIVVAAGPGSGKTRVLVHKLASLLLLEGVKQDQLLMLTFSRAAATEFKKRLQDLIGSAANYVEIKTFHSYCFDLLGKVGSLEESGNVIREGTDLIQNGEVEQSRITKHVLVLDEAQDMDKDEFSLIEALMQANPAMRVIAVGDDDQNIFEFRGSDSKYMEALLRDHGAVKYEMNENYRSKSGIVALSNAFIAQAGRRMKTIPIQAVQQEPGTVELIRYRSSNMVQALVRQVMQTYHGESACILTNTNDEALQVLGLLTREGVRARLIQSNDGFNLYHLAELRFFLKYLEEHQKTPAIDDALWNQALEQLASRYADSACLANCQNLLRDFDQISQVRFRTDLEQFIKESNFDDFYGESTEKSICISTIHKAKGREFDTVYLLLNSTYATDDATLRRLYVAMTRAKDTLYIHCNTSLFDRIRIPGMVRTSDDHTYPEPDELLVHLTHKDVYLSYFARSGIKKQILSLRSGDPLSVDGSCLTAEIEGWTKKVVQFSKAFSEKLAGYREKGYEPAGASVRFIVAWHAENDPNEFAVLLPAVTLRRSHEPEKEEPAPTS